MPALPKLYREKVSVANEIMKKLILASASPAKKALLEQIGVVFTVQASDYQEDMSLNLDIFELAKKLSSGKAQVVARKNPGAVVLAADTFIVFEGKLLGKPKTASAAKRMLMALSGKQHSVVTGFTVIDIASNKHISEAIETKVYFRNLSAQEIDAYIATGEPLDKAGAYAIQSKGAEFVSKIEGDYSNVIGLPIARVSQVLKEFGF